MERKLWTLVTPRIPASPFPGLVSLNETSVPFIGFAHDLVLQFSRDNKLGLKTHLFCFNILEKMISLNVFLKISLGVMALFKCFYLLNWHFIFS